MRISLSNPELVKDPYTGQQGLYSACTPDDDSANWLIALASSFDLTLDKSKLHCTIMYSPVAPDALVSDFEIDPDQQLEALCNGVDYWKGHDGAGVLVARLTSLDMQREHRKLTACGCQHTYVPFKPHVTLFSGIEDTVGLRNMMGSINAVFASEQVHLMFNQQFIADIKND